MDPIRDYDTFVNGKWKATHQIPKDRTRWSTFDMCSRKIEKQLIRLCEADTGLVGEIYQKVMQPPPADIAPSVKQMLADVQGVQTLDDFIRLSWRFYTQGVQTFFGISVQPDAKNSAINLPHFYQSGLGLPEKSYYRDAVTLKEYNHYVADLTQLYGFTVTFAPLLAFEQRLAALHSDPTTLRDVEQTYNLLTGAELPAFFQLLNIPLPQVVVQNRALLQALPVILEETSLSVLRDYLRYKVASSYSLYQTQAIRQCNFNFYRGFLLGQKRHHSKQVKALYQVKQWLPVHLQQLYLKYNYTEKNQERCLAMVQALITACRAAIRSADWMTALTKKTSLAKLKRLKIGVGRPLSWPPIKNQWVELDVARSDLSSLQQSRTSWSYAQHVVRLFYQPVDRDLWTMCVYEVNASYDLNRNLMIIPAGIMQKPFFGFAQASRNFGGLGSVIGHELTHAFDDQGRKFNPLGNVKNWWTQPDILAFRRRAQKVQNFFARLAVHGHRVNGKLTLGENLADIGGLTLALRAFQTFQTFQTQADLQDFFRTYATLWRALMNPTAEKKSLLMNPHAPERFRINAVVSHMAAFHKAYDHPLSPATERQLAQYSIWF